MLRATRFAHNKRPLPTLPQLQVGLQGVSQFLIDSQKQGFGVDLVSSMNFDPKKSVDVLVTTTNTKRKENLHLLLLQQQQNQEQVEKYNNDNLDGNKKGMILESEKPIESVASFQSLFALTVSSSAADSSNRLHSGTITTLADVFTSLPIWCLAGMKSVHVSVAIDCHILVPESHNVITNNSRVERPRVGESFICSARVPKMGAKLAFTEFEFYATNQRSLSQSLRKLEAEKERERHEFCIERVVDTKKNLVEFSTGEDVLSYYRQQQKENQNSDDDDFLLKILDVPTQFALLQKYATAFATGTHEKAFVEAKKK